jgi:hypothetical protein
LNFSTRLPFDWPLKAKGVEMKNLIIAIIGVAVLSTTVPALAGPDWQIIEHGRVVKAKKMQADQASRERSLISNKSSNPDDHAEPKMLKKPCDRTDK